MTLAFSGTFTGVSNQAPPAKHSVPQNPGMVWDEPHRAAGSTFLPRFLQSSTWPSFPHWSSPTSQEHTKPCPTTLCSPFSLVPDLVAGMVTRTLPGVDDEILSTRCCLCSGTAEILCLKVLVRATQELFSPFLFPWILL